MGTNRLLAGNLASLTFAILAFLGLLPWPIAGYLIVASVQIASLTYLTPYNGHTSNPQESPALSPVTTVREKPDEQIDGWMDKNETRPSEPSQNPASSKLLSLKTVPPKTDVVSQEPSREGNGPEGSTRIGEGDYLSFDLELDEGEEAACEVSSGGDVNVYVLTQDNLNALDMDQEFWYEDGKEGVRKATLHFKAPQDGTWFLVVENVAAKETFATVKITLNKASHSTPLPKTETLGLPDAKLEGKL